jgi:hypothetical protein
MFLAGESPFAACGERTGGDTMAQATLARVLEEIKTLEIDELRQVQRTVRSLLEEGADDAGREAALRVLEESGLVKEIKRPPLTSRRERSPVPIRDKPLSETVIEERR